MTSRESHGPQHGDTRSRGGPAGPEPPGSRDGVLRRLEWRSRRGLLELELALAPFVRRRLHELSEQDLARYARLLEHDDVDIYEWLQERAQPEDPELVAIVAEVRAANTP